MSVSCKGVVLTPVKDVFLVTGLVEAALNGLIRRECRLIRRECSEGYPGQSLMRPLYDYRLCDTSLSISGRLVTFNFTFRGEARRLYVFFDCDCDHADLAPKSISLSIGLSGHAELYVKKVLHALSILGPVYFSKDNGFDEEPAPLGLFTPTVMNLIAMGSYPSVYVDRIVSAFDAGAFENGRTFEDVLGVEETWLRAKLSESNHREAWRAIDERAKEISYPSVSYEDEKSVASVA